MNSMRTLVMGILNVTPDSFSDGGAHFSPTDAIGAAEAMVEAGADIIDIGGESTRPGATPISAEEEWERIGGVVAHLAKAGVRLSVDTYHAQTARRAGDVGVEIINDVTGGAGDADMYSAVAATGCLYVLQHSRGPAAGAADYGENIGRTVAEELAAARMRAGAGGIDVERIILDPGFGFSKDSAQCWALAANLNPVFQLGRPVLIGVSRKRFLAEVSQGDAATDRDGASAALALYAASRGAWAVRAHNVALTRAAVDVAARLREAGAAFPAAGEPGEEAANAWQQAERLGRRDGKAGLRDFFTKAPGLNSGELWG